MSKEKNTRVTIKDVKVIFVSLEDEGFGKSITIDCTDPAVEKAISDWYKENNIGKASDATRGVPKIKEYEGTKQFAFKINDRTKLKYLSGLTEKDLSYGATVSITANAFDYDNKFGKGTGQSAMAVLVVKSGGGADEAMDDLLGGYVDVTGEDVDFA